MKKLVYLLTAVLVSFLSLQNAVAAERADSLKLTYGQGNGVSMVSPSNKEKKGGSAIYISGPKLALYKGNTLSAISVYLTNNQGLANMKVFITKDLSAGYDYVQEVQSPSRMWNNVTLDTPYVLDGEPFYIGYEAEGVMMSYSKRARSGEEWIYKADKWEKYEDNVYSAALAGIVKGNSLPAHDVAVSGVIIPQYAVAGEMQTVTGTIENFGVETVESVVFEAEIAGEKFEQTVEGLDVKYQSTATFEVPLYSIAAEGEPVVNVRLIKVNGVDDVEMSDNGPAQRTVVCRNEFLQRKALMEVMSTEKCSNCPTAHKALNNIMKTMEDVVILEHHAGYFYDKFTLDESRAYEWFFNGRISAPSFMIDRTNFIEEYPSVYADYSPMPNFPAEKQLRNIMETAKAVPAEASVDLEVLYDRDTRSLGVTVSGKQLLPLSGDNDRLFAFITEDSIFSESQAGSYGDYTHNHMARLALTETWGEEISLKDGYSFSHDLILPDTIVWENAAVVAFVANYDPEDVNNCNVYNTAYVKLKDLFASVDNATVQEFAVVYRNGEVVATAPASAMALYSINGTCIRQIPGNVASMSLQGIAPGVYVARAVSESGGDVAVCKIIVREK